MASRRPHRTLTSNPEALPLPRRVSVAAIADKVAELLMEANYDIGDELLGALRKARQVEASELGCQVLDELVLNYELARAERVPACQDTGVPVVFLDIGQDVHLVGGDLEAAVQEGIRRGSREGYLRNSIVADPLWERRNTGDNTPGVVHVRIVPGDRVHLTVASKGFGSENKSRLAILLPGEGVEGVKRFVLETVSLAGAQACPPFVVGVGVGGTFELAALLAKRAVVRPLGRQHPDERVRRLEADLLAEINRLGIGPQGFGGVTTALAVHVETYPTHIASLPVAVNVGCHSNRHKEAVI